MPGGYARYVLLLMVGINLLNYADRWVGSAVAPLIQREFGLSDFLVGALGSAFLLVYAVSALPFGYWADRGPRRHIIALGVGVWSVVTLLSGFVASYAQLFVTRCVLGLGEATYYPPGTSLLSDYFPERSRGRAMAIWNAGAVLGAALGFGAGGYVGEHFGWRRAFLMAALPGLLLALLAARLREPVRGAAERVGPAKAAKPPARPPTGRGEGGSGPESPRFRDSLGLFRITSLRAVILAQTALFFVIGSNAFWLPTVINRRYGLTLSQAGLIAGATIVAGGVAGTLAGGWLADRLSPRLASANLLVGLAGFLLGAVTITAAILAPYSIGPVPVFVPLFFVSAVLLYLYSGPFTAAVQNVVAPAGRASAVALTLLVTHLFGDAFSPAVIGWLSDRFHSLQFALLVTSAPLLLLAAGLAATGLRGVRRDTEAMEREWAGRPHHARS